MTKYTPRRSRARRWIENILLLAGVAALGVWVWAIASKAVYQDWANWVFDQQTRGETATLREYLRGKLGLACAQKEQSPSLPPLVSPAAPPVSPNANGKKKDLLLGRLSIPRLDLEAMVREGVDEKTLGLALGHIPGTALPGENGNVGVAGHRDTLFRGLRKIQRNDLIRFETSSGSHEYRVESTRIVTPKDVGVLASHQSPELTLVTCYPFYYVGSAPDRFIVTAREVTPPASESSAVSPPTPTQTPAPTPEPAVAAVSLEKPPVAPAGILKAARRPSVRGVSLEITKDRSRQLAPGISMGVTGISSGRQRVDGWMWVMPDRHTIWLHARRTHDPVFFYRRSDGHMHELVITSIANNSVRVSLQ